MGVREVDDSFAAIGKGVSCPFLDAIIKRSDWNGRVNRGRNLVLLLTDLVLGAWVSGRAWSSVGIESLRSEAGEWESSELMSGIMSWPLEVLEATEARDDVEVVRANRAAIGRKSEGPATGVLAPDADRCGAERDGLGCAVNGAEAKGGERRGCSSGST